MTKKAGEELKRSILTIILLSFCAYVYATEFPSVFVNISPRIIRSNSVETFELTISNRRSFGNREIPTLYNLELSVEHNDDLIVTLSQTRIDFLEPGDNFRINMEITNNHKFFFDEVTFITVNVSNEDYESSFPLRFTIRQVENFWFFVILTSMVIGLFVIIYIKANKREKNAG
ncbi:MAG: hypothetical protein FWC64_05485 [Treponema sp.]|nr:hypothetical protein [Treponema sp.]